LESSLKLDEQYNFLTVSIYKQIKALQDQGNTIEAAKVAQNAYADALAERTAGIEQNLGSIERGWMNVTKFAKGAWDAMLGVGRDTTESERIEQLQRNIANRADFISRERPQSLLIPKAQADNAKDQAELNLLLKKTEQQKIQGELKAKEIALKNAGIEFDRQGEKFLTSALKLENDIAKARKLGADAGLSTESIEKRVAVIRKDYAEKNKKTRQEKSLADQVAFAELKKIRDAEKEMEKQFAADTKQFSKDQIKRTKEVTDSLINQISRQDKAYFGIVEQQDAYRQSLQENADLMQLEASLMGQSATDRNTAIEQYKIEIALKKELLKIEEDINLTRAQKDERSDVARENASIAKSQAAIKVQQQEWSKFYADIYNGLTDSLYRGFEAGKGFFQSFWDGIKNLFKTTVLKLAVQGVMTGVSGTFQSALSSYAQNSGNNSFASIGKSIWDGFSLAGTVGGGISQMGGMFGSSTLSAFGSGMSGVAGGTFAGAGPTLAGSSTGLGALAGTGGTTGVLSTGAGAGTAAAGAGSSAAAALPIVGWVIAGMMANNSLYDKGWGGKSSNETKQLGIASGMVGGALKETIQKWFGLSDKSASMWSGSAVVNRLFGYKAAEIQQSELSGSFGAGGYSGSTRDVYKQKGGVFRGDKWSETINKQDASAMTEAFTSIKEAAKGYANILGLSTDALNTFTKDFKVNLSITGDAAKDAEANQKILTDILTGVTNDLSNLLAPALSGFAKEGESASATLQRLATGLSDVNFIMRSVGFDEFAKSLEGSNAATRLSELTGGIEKLASGAQYFFENFLTDAEKIKPSSDLVTDTMKRLGQSSVDTIAEFKTLIQGLDLASESGAKMYAELIAIAPQFKAVADYTSELTGALTEFESAAKAAADAAKLESDILSQRVSLQNEYNQLTMTSTELLALQRNEIYESNRALFDSISAVKQKREAEISAAEANKALTQTMIKNAELAQQILINAVDAERKVSQSVLESTLAILDSRKSASATVFETQKAILGASLSAAKSLASTLYSEANRIDGIAKSMVLADNPNNIGGSVFAAQAKLRSGDTSAETIKLATSSTQDMFASWADYAQNFFETKSLLQSSAAKAYSVAGEAMSQADAISAQLVAAEESYKSDLTHYAEQEKIARETMSQQTAYFDKIVSIATLALQEAQGTKIAVLSLPAAILNANANIQALASRTERPAQLIPSEPPANDLLLTEIRDLLVEQGRSSERLTTIMNDATNGGTIIRTVSA